MQRVLSVYEINGLQSGNAYSIWPVGVFFGRLPLSTKRALKEDTNGDQFSSHILYIGHPLRSLAGVATPE